MEKEETKVKGEELCPACGGKLIQDGACKFCGRVTDVRVWMEAKKHEEALLRA